MKKLKNIYKNCQYSQPHSKFLEPGLDRKPKIWKIVQTIENSTDWSKNPKNSTNWCKNSKKDTNCQYSQPHSKFLEPSQPQT